ncbi:MAG: Mu transposase C-terminal domain-containing protein [Blastocatellia bacterium]
MRKNGVQCFRKDWFYYNEAMAGYKERKGGTKVEIRFTDRDYSRIWVVLPNNELCEAPLITPTSIIDPSKETLSKVAKARAHERKIIRDFNLLVQSELRSETVEDRAVAETHNPKAVQASMDAGAEKGRVHKLTRLERAKKRTAVSLAVGVTGSAVGEIETDPTMFLDVAKRKVREFDCDE